MKARILATGSIVEVKYYTDSYDHVVTSITALYGGNFKRFNKDEFELLPDEPLTNELATTEPDLEQRRYELAKAAMQGLCAEFETVQATDKQLVEEAIQIADLMIAELKKAK